MIELYLTRDMNGDLYLHDTEPHLDDDPLRDENEQAYVSRNMCWYLEDDILSPSLQAITFENSPIKLRFEL